MSRAFLNEDKFEQVNDEVVERPISGEPNYVTASGLHHLKYEVQRLEALRDELTPKKEDPFAALQLAEAERDLRYFTARLESAILVDTGTHPKDEIRFGAIVDVEDENMQVMEFRIVGEDEADIAKNKVNWASPLARALIGHKVGDSVVWQRPAGPLELTITGIRYSS